MKALVTGATGFVGGLLATRLRERGDAVVALVRDPTRAGDLAAAGVQLVKGDLADRAALAAAVRDTDVIYHVAGAIAAPNEARFMAVNRDGCAALVDAAQLAGSPRFVLVSSLAAAGPSPPGHPHRDTTLAEPVSQYGRSKLAAERVMVESTLPWTIVRPPAVYGPRDRELLRVFSAVARFGLGPVFGQGTQELSLIYGPDLAEALIAAGTSPSTVRQTFYASHPETHTSRSMVTTIASAAGRRARVIPIPVGIGRVALRVTDTLARLTGRTTVLTADKGNELFQPAWTCDPTALTTTTGWSARTPLAEGARQTLDWYRRAGWV